MEGRGDSVISLRVQCPKIPALSPARRDKLAIFSHRRIFQNYLHFDRKTSDNLDSSEGQRWVPGHKTSQTRWRTTTGWDLQQKHYSLLTNVCSIQSLHIECFPDVFIKKKNNNVTTELSNMTSARCVSFKVLKLSYWNLVNDTFTLWIKNPNKIKEKVRLEVIYYCISNIDNYHISVYHSIFSLYFFLSPAPFSLGFLNFFFFLKSKSTQYRRSRDPFVVGTQPVCWPRPSPAHNYHY